MEVDIIQRSLQFKLTLDLCNFKFAVSIEKRTIEVSLVDFEYGELLDIVMTHCKYGKLLIHSH